MRVRRSRVATKGQNAKFTANLRIAECGGLGLGQSAEFTSSALDDAARELIGESGSLGAGALRVGKNVEIGERQILDKAERGSVIFFGFARETGDDIGADGGVGEEFADELDAAGIVFGAIPAMHGGEDTVGSGLERHVEVRGEAIGRREESDHVAGNVERLNGTDAKALNRCLVEDETEEIEEFDARRKVAAVSTKVDATKNDFLVAGRCEALEFAED